MENTVRLAKSEIRNWLEIRGYHCKDIYVIDNVIVECQPKISSKDLNEFEIEFNHKPSLDSVFFDESGEKNYKYYFNHDNLVKLYSKINAFFDENEISIQLFIIGIELSVYTYEKLSDVQIKELEEEFNVKCRGYSISCDSNKYTYNFRWGN